ncbi:MULTISPECIES: helix-turn-helix domain-containing protein [unclassified Mucilaginibacter]|uniref:winged helix-turn-helix transcriptional regulator n=1 Tax=unclassified Mucilaginibacter TaxID=2617802 RepID=UPI002AC99638|nr:MULTISPECIES: helix-turn-helix domain-containing protein [unclassified Mucilaginibacter]MEB0261598.1 helix-turn-helix domain-containing protein [Mucilaginibacter sp. 10I4]MEB0277148.1 helix-turn-helix domain-containing protein [Mucilaginibacter sp. 10B2]MEB0301406.1 helix-turn-helix domain-containing protein [Mucilaginibacter sp. 5C4]WPX25248.1 helix-turn-helix domain-containing protein [Mucilaginibacter sp. 5C4]
MIFFFVDDKGIFVLTFLQVLTLKYVSMTAIKESSTRNENKEIAINACPVSYLMNKIGGHWKPIILYQLMSGPKRYNELKKAIPNITEKMLIQHLKQLQEDDLVIRKSEPVVPPHVTYKLSKTGESLTPVMEAIATWGFKFIGKN